MKNNSQLSIFDSFIELYGDDKMCKAIDCRCITFNQCPFCGVNKNDSPFETASGNIACSIEICKDLNLSDCEMYAMIAHEVGHIYYQTWNMCIPILCKEILADSAAIHFGLEKELASALNKLVNSGNYEDVKKDLCTRIDVLLNQGQ